MVKLFTASAVILCALAIKAQGALGDCGEDNVVGDRIVGGGEVVKHSIPWQVALVGKGSDRPFCGGTIIDSNHILTAAHCTQGESAEYLQVLTGEHDLTVAQGETRHNVKRIISHESYGQDTGIDFDFSILTIDCGEEIDLTDKARAACLPTTDDISNYESSGAQFNVSGWGALQPGQSGPDVLHVVTVPFVPDSVCKDRYGDDRITARMICAGNTEQGGIDSCQGDSGGPMTWRDNQGKWKIVGVVSWGISCADQQYPGVYAEVTSVLDWIAKNTEDSCDGTNPNPTQAPTNAPSSSTEGPSPTDGPVTTEMPPFPTGEPTGFPTGSPFPTGDPTGFPTDGPFPTGDPTGFPTDGPFPTGDPTGCNTAWIDDGYCDDGNNNKECQFDGGDCCQNPAEAVDGWDQYCTKCECLDDGSGTTGFPTGFPTGDPTGFPTDGPFPTGDPTGFPTDGPFPTGDPTGFPTDGPFPTGDPTGFPTDGPFPTGDPTGFPTDGPFPTGDPTDGECNPFWIGDGYCDDENNNKECQFDGGDCCQSTAEAMEDWDMYCTKCECLEDSTDGSSCEDVWPESKCLKRLDKGKCHNPNVEKNCQKTCGWCWAP